VERVIEMSFKINTSKNTKKKLVRKLFEDSQNVLTAAKPETTTLHQNSSSYKIYYILNFSIFSFFF
jgi:hypothetical protein